jgi:hypothetical protein
VVVVEAELVEVELGHVELEVEEEVEV